jgi:hypothetical protein
LVKPFFIRRAGEKLPAASRRCSGCLTIGAFSPLSITDFSLQNSSISKFVVFFYSLHRAGFFVFHRLVQPIYFIHSLGDYRLELSIDWFDLFCVSAFFHCLSKETSTAVASILLFPLDRPAEFIKFPKFPQTSWLFARVSLAQAAPKPSDSVPNRLQNVSKGRITDGVFDPLLAVNWTPIYLLKKIPSSRFFFFHPPGFTRSCDTPRKGSFNFGVFKTFALITR